MREQRHVLFYYRPGCGECAEAKEFLDRSGARYMGFDISKDEEALRDLEERWGCSDCATLVIDGEIFAGFHANIDKIQKLLGGVDPRVLDEARWVDEGGPDVEGGRPSAPR